MSSEKPKQQPEVPAEPAKPETKRTVSERKLRANRENAKKSTGPRSARGKWYSSFNAATHGMLARRVAISPDGQVDERLNKLFFSLRNRFDCNDIVNELLVELVVTDYWRLQKGLEFEMNYLRPTGYGFDPSGCMPPVGRYNTANRRAFDKSLQMLIEMQNKAEEELAEAANHDEAESNVRETETTETESDASGEDAATEPPQSGGTSGLDGNPPPAPAAAPSPQEDPGGESQMPEPSDRVGESPTVNETVDRDASEEEAA